MKDILPVWQEVGMSTHQIAKQVSQLKKVKTSHTGTLDPMAEGVVIILLGETRLKKYDFAKWKKTYEFEIAFGISTDSFDGMGLITKTKFKKVEKSDLEKALVDLKGDYEQKVPLFSAKKYKGKSMFEYAMDNEKVARTPKKKGIIYNIKLVSLYEKSAEEIVDDIIDRIVLVEGAFRQTDIVSGWEHIRSDLPEKFQIAKVKVTTSKGLYIRSLSQDICDALKVPGFVYTLERTRNGFYTKLNSKKLPKLFGSFFNRDNFTSRFETGDD